MKDNDNEQPTETASVPTYLSLCSGYDGIGLGLKRVIPELRTVAHVEIEAFAIENLVTKMEEGQLDSAPVFTDLKRFPFEDLRERQPTILSAGFPCQPFSSAGKRQATDDPRHLYPFIANGITACRPEYVFLENVDGIVSSKTADGESVLLYVLRDLEERGYECTWGTFSAAEIGAPHLRKRVFILAKLADGESIERQRTLTSGDRCERPEETVGSSSSYVADGVSKGLEGHAGDVNETTGQTGRGTHRPISQSGLSRTVYPSRPGERQCSWEEPRVVADAKSGESGESQAGNRRQDTGGGGEQLGNASSERSHRGSEDCEGEQSEVSGTRHELVNAEESGLQGRGESHLKDRREHPKDGTEVFDGSSDASSHEGVSECEESSSEAQSELGGTTDGTARGVDAITNRVDRLRLLGNGVVPDCAELAFRTLFNQLHNNER